MKHFSKLCILLAVLSALVLAGCSQSISDNNEQTTQKQSEEQVCEHEWDDGVITTEPTCTAVGEKTFTCKLCKETKKEPVEALGHDWVLDEDTATCTTDGKKKYHCSRCPETKEENSPAHHHEDYETSGYCETCGAYKYEDKLIITAIIRTSEEDEEVFNTDITKLKCDVWSFPKEKGNDYISLEDILHMKSKYKDCKVKCWKNGYVTFEKSSDITERRIKNWSDGTLYVIIE